MISCLSILSSPLVFISSFFDPSKILLYIFILLIFLLIPPSSLREKVLGTITSVVREFVYKASLSHGHSESQARSAGGKIFTFGSYRLGVHGPGADIDTLCVVPKHIQREDFFTIFEDMLQKREDVEDIASVPDAYVPLIKVKFAGISIDFLFARLGTARIEDSLELGENSILKGLDERDQRSLNG